MDRQVEEMMGEDFLRQMHIAMGKRSQSPDSFGMMTMMGMMMQYSKGGDSSMMGYPSMMGWGSSLSVLGVITWLALIAFLITGAVFFWRNSKKK